MRRQHTPHKTIKQKRQYADDVARITAAAAKELVIEGELRKLGDAWRGARLALHKYTRNGADRGWVLKGAGDVLQLLEDAGLNLQSMAASPHARPFADDVRRWEQRLGLVGEVVAAWAALQRRWLHLEAVFAGGADDIRQQLPHEAKRFDGADRAWRALMAETSKGALVLDACGVPGRCGGGGAGDSLRLAADGQGCCLVCAATSLLYCPDTTQPLSPVGPTHKIRRLDQLRGLTEQLERCQKSLGDYLDAKRAAFPRLYFVSDEELLSVLGTADPAAVQEHMPKLFDNAAALRFARGGRAVVGLRSAEGEEFAFRSAVAVEGPVEVRQRRQRRLCVCVLGGNGGLLEWHTC